MTNGCLKLIVYVNGDYMGFGSRLEVGFLSSTKVWVFVILCEVSVGVNS